MIHFGAVTFTISSQTSSWVLLLVLLVSVTACHQYCYTKKYYFRNIFIQAVGTVLTDWTKSVYKYLLSGSLTCQWMFKINVHNVLKLKMRFLLWHITVFLIFFWYISKIVFLVKVSTFMGNRANLENNKLLLFNVYKYWNRFTCKIMRLERDNVFCF